MSDHIDPLSEPKDNQVRKGMIQFFYSLVLTQMAIYVSALIGIRSSYTLGFAAVCLHMVLAFVVTTTSWFGWQMSMRSSHFDPNRSVFQWAYCLAVIDIILVSLYLLLVHQTEIRNVSTFPSDTPARIIRASSIPEARLLFLIFMLYALWDLLCVKENVIVGPPHHSLECAVVALAACGISYAIEYRNRYLVIAVDLLLIELVIFFRSLRISGDSVVSGLIKRKRLALSESADWAVRLTIYLRFSVWTLLLMIIGFALL